MLTSKNDLNTYLGLASRLHVNSHPCYIKKKKKTWQTENRRIYENKLAHLKDSKGCSNERQSGWFSLELIWKLNEVTPLTEAIAAKNYSGLAFAMTCASVTCKQKEERPTAKLGQQCTEILQTNQPFKEFDIHHKCLKCSWNTLRFWKKNEKTFWRNLNVFISKC